MFGMGRTRRLKDKRLTRVRSIGSLGQAFTVRNRTGNHNQMSFYPSVPHEISVLVELILGHLRYLLTDVPPQPNSPPDNVFRPDRPAERALGPKRGALPRFRFTK
ncbi:Regulator of rDNA transcription protein 15 [Capsicum annuum]|uniref:Regulator of rDNA transcription protein 15 n=1 Tax=Capsicum annuum TaxID=4072 RepID=A0A2G2XJ83_CAPAN|nr:Regulator of rDNA transcription protein 15 [Capsicum annuum]